MPRVLCSPLSWASRFTSQKLIQYIGLTEPLGPFFFPWLCCHPHWARIGVWQSGHLIPIALRRSLSSWRGTFIGYVCNPSSLRGRDAGSRGHTSGIPASACFIPRSWRRFHRTCFYASWSLYHPARDVSPIHWSDYTRDSERGHSGGVPIALRCSVSFFQGTRVTYVT